MRKRGVTPHCTAAVSVQSESMAKAGHWETEKAGSGAGAWLPTRKSEDRRCAFPTALPGPGGNEAFDAGIRLRRVFAAAFCYALERSEP